MHPLAGQWTVNQEKSRGGLNSPLHCAALRLEISGDTVKIIDEDVNPPGHRQDQSPNLICNGQPRPIAGTPGLVAVGILGAQQLELVTKRGRAVMSRTTYVASDDDRSMTVTTSGIDARGHLFHQVLLFDRREAEHVRGVA